MAESSERKRGNAGGRLRAFFVSLLDAPPKFYVLVTHSGPMRAFLRDALGVDPGEPDFREAFRVNARGVYYRAQRGEMLKSEIKNLKSKDAHQILRAVWN